MSAPRSAISMASARPMPREDPVIIATLPERLAATFCSMRAPFNRRARPPGAERCRAAPRRRATGPCAASSCRWRRIAGMRGDLVHPRKPDTALCHHVLDELDHCVAARRPPRHERVPYRDPQPAVPPGRVELGAKHLHGALGSTRSATDSRTRGCRRIASSRRERGRRKLDQDLLAVAHEIGDVVPEQRGVVVEAVLRAGDRGCAEKRHRKAPDSRAARAPVALHDARRSPAPR